MFRVGTVGLTCAAYMVAIEPATEDRKGIVTPVRDCPNPVAVVIGTTGLCASCVESFQKPEIYNAASVKG